MTMKLRNVPFSPPDMTEAEAIRELKVSPLASEDCRARAVECFDKDRCFERYVDLYNEFLC